jgi:hypothetical protein
MALLPGVFRSNVFIKISSWEYWPFGIVHPLVLEVGYDIDADDTQSMETSVFRELTYNIEHAVHHMAMIKIGLRDVAPYVVLPPDFGIAMSTLRHKASLMAEH